jgi:hypothetical protein
MASAVLITWIHVIAINMFNQVAQAPESFSPCQKYQRIFRGNIMAFQYIRKRKQRTKGFRVYNRKGFKNASPAKLAQDRVIPGDSALIELSGKEYWALVVDHKSVNGIDLFHGEIRKSLNDGKIPGIKTLVFSHADIIQVRRF